MKKALITGVTGQDGSYLAEYLISMGYMVYGMNRRSSVNNTYRISSLLLNENFKLVYGDVLDQSSIEELIKTYEPDEIYHLAAQSFVGMSWSQPVYTSECVAIGTLRVLEAIRKINSNIKFYFAGSSEQFGRVVCTPQNESTPFYPRSPYGVSKVFGFEMTRNYRESYNMFACSGILFNHESPRRGMEFVTQKIAHGVVDYYYNHTPIELGNLNSKRDWGHAKDYVVAMHSMLQADKPDDYVVASGETHTIRELCERAFNVIDIDIDWVGEGINERGIDIHSSEIVVTVNPTFYRPAEVDLLKGDASKARKELNWSPSVSFSKLVEEMVKNAMFTTCLKGEPK